MLPFDLTASCPPFRKHRAIAIELSCCCRQTWPLHRVPRVTYFVPSLGCSLLLNAPLKLNIMPSLRACDVLMQSTCYMKCCLRSSVESKYPSVIWSKVMDCLPGLCKFVRLSCTDTRPLAGYLHSHTRRPFYSCEDTRWSHCLPALPTQLLSCSKLSSSVNTRKDLWGSGFSQCRSSLTVI